MKIHVVISEGNSCETGSFMLIRGIYLSKKRAIKKVKEIVARDKREYPNWYEDSRFTQNWSEDSSFFEIYEDKYYEQEHFTVWAYTYDTKCKY